MKRDCERTGARSSPRGSARRLAGGDDDVTRTEVVRGLVGAGLHSGDVVLVHSAMRSLGYVQGGAETVVSALLDVLGGSGTLVVPTFTFAHEAERDPVVSPASDTSEMGIISEAVRVRPDALRSTAYRHSFAAVGRRARYITGVDPTLSPFDPRSSFGVMLGLSAQVLLLGMTYATSTGHHFAEYICEVPYRHTVDLTIRVRQTDGSVVLRPMTDYQPKPAPDGSYYGSRHPDFNRLGRMLEERNLVGFSSIGNGVVRRFGLRDLIDLAQIEADKDYNVFRTPEGEPERYTLLTRGTVVASPEMRDGAGRPCVYHWCVEDESKLVMPHHL